MKPPWLIWGSWPVCSKRWHPDARVILLGDHNQLASVAPGAVLGDLVRAGSCECYSEEFLEKLCRDRAEPAEELAAQGATGALDDCLNVLTNNYRFSATSGIARHQQRCCRGRCARGCSAAGGCRRGCRLASRCPRLPLLLPASRTALLRVFASIAAVQIRLEALARFDDFRILCAVREGPFGVQALNVLVEELLAADGLIAPHGVWYHGRPVLVTRNHYPLRLFNGDIGIAFELEKGAPLRVCFAGPDGELARIQPGAAARA